MLAHLKTKQDVIQKPKMELTTFEQFAAMTSQASETKTETI